MFPHPLILLELVEARHGEVAGRVSRAERVSRRRRRATSRTAVHFAHREADGITVDLYWTHGESGDAFRVDVVDYRRGVEFTLRPASGKAAIDAYHHPFFALAMLAEAGDSAGATAIGAL